MQMENNKQNFLLAIQSVDKINVYSSDDSYSELSLDSLQTHSLILSYSMSAVTSGPSYLVVQLKESPICVVNSIEYKMEFFISTADQFYKEIMSTVQSAVAGNNKVQILYPNPLQRGTIPGKILLGKDLLDMCAYPLNNTRGNIMYCPIRRLTVFSE